MNDFTNSDTGQTNYYIDISVFSNEVFPVLKWLNDQEKIHLIIDNDGRIVFHNKAFAEKWGIKTGLIFDLASEIGLEVKHDEFTDEIISSKTTFSHKDYGVESSKFADDDKLLISFFRKNIIEKDNELTDQLLARYNVLLSKSTAGIMFVSSKNKLVIDANSKAATIFGFKNIEEFKGKSFGSLGLSLDFLESKEMVTKILAQGCWVGQKPLLSVTGNSTWYEVEVTMVECCGNDYLFFVKINDINERKNVEVELRQSLKLYQDLVMHNQALMCTHDMHGTILTVNASSYKALGYDSESEIVGRNLRFLFDPKNLDGFKNYIDEINEKGSSQGVMEVVSKYGKKVYWVYHNYKVDDGVSKSYVVGSAQDITERILTEKELKKAKVMAEKSLRSRELFFANVSHELRTPLHGILGLNNLMLKSPLNEEQKSYGEIIQRSADSLLVLVNDILDVAKMESGKFEFEETAFSLSDTIQKSIEPLKIKAKEKNIELELHLPLKKIAPIIGDPYRLSQIIINLVNNAIKFTSIGKVVLGVEIVAETSASVTFDVFVVDTGMGIPDEKQEALFDSFIQMSASHAREFGGTGLGLSICKKLVELQKGKIYCTSKVGDGSKFGFVINYLKSDVSFESLNYSKESADSDFENMSVLLVEDNAINQLICKFVLDSKKVKVAIAENGEEALGLVASNNFNLILMDINLPDMSGSEVTSKIRKMPDVRKSSVPIIAITANAMKGDSEIYLKSGMDNYLSKPYTEEELFEKIANTLYTKNEDQRSIRKLEEANKRTSVIDYEQYDNFLLMTFFEGNDFLVESFKELCLKQLPVELRNLEYTILKKNVLGVQESLIKINTLVYQMGNYHLNFLVEEVENCIFKNTEWRYVVPNLYKIIVLSTQLLEVIQKERMVA